jgi:hypothetical protein
MQHGCTACIATNNCTGGVLEPEAQNRRDNGLAAGEADVVRERSFPVVLHSRRRAAHGHATPRHATQDNDYKVRPCARHSPAVGVRTAAPALRERGAPCPAPDRDRTPSSSTAARAHTHATQYQQRKTRVQLPPEQLHLWLLRLRPLHVEPLSQLPGCCRSFDASSLLRRRFRCKRRKIRALWQLIIRCAHLLHARTVHCGVVDDDDVVVADTTNEVRQSKVMAQARQGHRAAPQVDGAHEGDTVPH